MLHFQPLHADENFSTKGAATVSFDNNPYQSPVNYPLLPQQGRLADLGKRFLGAVVDGLFGAFVIVPGYALIVISSMNSPKDPPPLLFVGLGLLFLGFIVSLVVQIYLLATRSQTLGKFVMKTQIVDINTGRPAGLLNTLVLRLLVNGLIGGIPCLGLIYTIVDICFIFREDRRCIHDLIASTRVVDIS